MGKDVRGIERGKCACGECEDFMRSDGSTYGYCGCLPTRHSKKDARYSSDSVGGTSAAGSNKWKRKSREVERWRPRVVPEPKGRIYWILKQYSAKILPVLLDHLSLQGTISPLFRDWKKGPAGSSPGFESNKSQSPARKHQNMGKSGHGSRETIMLVGRR